MKRILVIYNAFAGRVSTTHHYVDAFRRHSRFKVEHLCIEHVPSVPSDLSRYDAVWMNYCAGLAFEPHYGASTPESLRRSLAAYHGPKLIALQDEYDRTNRLREQLRAVGATVVLTCVPQQFLDYVYPRDMFPGVRFETVLTGYASDDLLGIDDIRPLADRPIVVGYRGRDLGARYGELARQKAQIGRRVREACLTRGIPCDIAIDEESRIYGPAWADFLMSCRIMLGSESGSNVFDFDGSIAAKYNEMKALDPSLSYESFQPIIAEREKEIDMAQISPRVFEAAAMRTAMALFRGRYSGLMQPDVHYVPVEPDYSNLDAVLDRIQDVPAMEAMAERTFRDLIASGSYSYRAFVHRIDDIIESEMHARPRPQRDRSMPLVNTSVVTCEPLGYDPFLIGELSRLLAEREALVAEIQRLNTVFGADRDKLVAEIQRLNDVYGKDRKILIAEIERMGGEFNRLNDAYAKEKQDRLAEQQRLMAEIERLKSGQPFETGHTTYVAHRSETDMDALRPMSDQTYVDPANPEHRPGTPGGTEAGTSALSDASRDYWTHHKVTLHHQFASPEESVEYFHWRNDQYFSYIDLMPVAGRDGAAVLDFGCGPGHDLVGFKLYSRPSRLIGADVSRSSLAQARARLALHGFDAELILLHASTPSIPLESASIDHIHSSGVLHHTPDPFALLKEFRRILKPGGTANIMVYNYDSIWVHLYVAYQKMLVENLYAGMSIREAFSRTTDGDDCPISHCYRVEEFIELCQAAGFEAALAGVAVSAWEASLLPKRFDAIFDRRLRPESRRFLVEIEIDNRGLPVYRGVPAGIDGCYRLRWPVG